MQIKKQPFVSSIDNLLSKESESEQENQEYFRGRDIDVTT